MSFGGPLKSGNVPYFRRIVMSCEPTKKPVFQANLEVNGGEVELNNFVEEFISQSVTGMVNSLRGVGEIETLSLKISSKEQAG